MSIDYNISSETAAGVKSLPKRNLLQAMKTGFLMRCPNCGKGKIFGRYLKVAHSCEACSEELHHHRADDAPPYFTIFLVGHIIVPAVLALEVAYEPSMWIHMALWLPVTVLLSLALLSPIKGAVVGLQWALYMHGFDPNSEDDHAIMANADVRTG
ncbi:MAG: DUF983 domain-containing protein [Stappiaceae bacterium]